MKISLINMSRKQLAICGILLVVFLLCVLSSKHIQAAAIIIFDDSTFVDTTESSVNLQAALSSFGHVVNTFSGTSAVDWSIIAGNDVVVIPELFFDLSTELSSGAQLILYNFVSNGGGLITLPGFTSSVPNTSKLLNAIFGFSIVESASGMDTILNVTAATGTAFSQGPATLPYLGDMDSLETNNLPLEALTIYQSPNGLNTGVALISQGLGKIVYYGWDLENAPPSGTAGVDTWIPVLSNAVDEVTIPVVPSIDDILTFFENSVENDELNGRGKGRLAKLRLCAMRWMLEVAGEFIDRDRIKAACFMLRRTYKRSDGNAKPPDFVIGNAVPELAEMVYALAEYLECKWASD